MNSLLYGLAAFSLWQTGLAADNDKVVDPAFRARAPERVTNILDPILPRELGLHRRDGPSVGLANDTSLFWGKNGNGNNHF
jgi:hypothetical protein